MRIRRIPVILGVCLSVAAGVSAVVAGGPKVAGGVLEFTLPDLGGRIVGNDDARFSGKVLLIDLWGTWCPPCATSIPTFVDLQDRYGGKGLEVIGIAFEKEGDTETRRRRLARFRDEHGIDYTILDGGAIEDFASSLPAVKNARGFPIEILVSRDGKVAAIRNGYGYSKKWARKLDREVRELLDEGGD